MKNAYLQQIKAKQHQAECNATYDGIAIGLNITAVALNRLFGFGNKRLTQLESEVNKIIQTEFIKRGDPEQAAHGLKKAVEQIRGRK